MHFVAQEEAQTGQYGFKRNVVVVPEVDLHLCAAAAAAVSIHSGFQF